MVQCQMSIVTGCMEFLAMRHRVHDIGHAGMERQPNSCALVDFFITNKHIVATGLRYVERERDSRRKVDRKRCNKNFNKDKKFF